MTPNPEGWLANYYAVPADEVPVGQALAHSLRKWEGLRPAVLEQFGLKLEFKEVGLIDEGGDFETVLGINSDSCALCQHHFKGPSEDERCTGCPLHVLRGCPCDANTRDEILNDRLTPYGALSWTNDPEPMIALLKLAIEKENAA